MHRPGSSSRSGFGPARINLLMLSCVAVCCGIVLALSGCGEEQPPEVVPVSGTVTQNGQPLADVIVKFYPKAGAPVASGVTGEDGRFQLSSFQRHDGAVAGEHEVGVYMPKTEADRAIADRRSPEEITQAMEKDAQSGAAEGTAEKESPIPERYADPKQSKLTATVSPGGQNDFPFDLQK